MNPVIAWGIGAAYISYRYGYKCNMLPLPKRFLALTAFVSMASLVSMANPTVGALLAYGSLLGMYFYGQSHPSNNECDKINVTGQPDTSSSTPKPQPAPGPSSGNPVGMPNPRPGPL